MIILHHMSRPKFSDKIQLSEDAIGIVSLTTSAKGQLNVYLDEAVGKAINADRVTWDKVHLRIGIGTMDTKGYKVNGNNGGYHFGVGSTCGAEDRCGLYECVPEGNYWQLYRIESEI